MSLTLAFSRIVSRPEKKPRDSSEERVGSLVLKRRVNIEGELVENLHVMGHAKSKLSPRV
jgi:hypothetical protein